MPNLIFSTSILHPSVFLIVVFLSAVVTQDDIIGCGGFIKADAPLDLTQIKVKLLTSYGSVKHTAEPDPNGYYMIPVYEKGEYQVQIQPKSGWNFEPSKPVNLDLEACARNEDVNFVFTGFRLSGQVLSGGSKEGPSDIEVVLFKDGKELRKVNTKTNGGYAFSNVLVGQYSVKARHPSLKFSKSEVQVTVTNDVVEVRESLEIHGYSISGRIFNDGQPVKGVKFVLETNTQRKINIIGCTAGSPPNYNKKDAICYTTSDEAGAFTFQSVPVGRYNIIPFHRGEKTVFDVTPNQQAVQLSHSSLTLERTFTVSGFGVSGQVRYSSKGKGVAGAVVSVDGREVTKADSQGTYAIDGMKAGTYTIRVHAPSVYFDDVQVHMLPSEPLLPTIIPTSFDLCGKVVLDNSKIRDMQMSVVNFGNTDIQQQVPVAEDGLFCVKVKPGTYTVKPVVKGGASSLSLTPSSLKITVLDSPIPSENVKFSQFKAVLSGKVVCLKSCGDVDVILRSKKEGSTDKTQKVTSTSSSVAFVFQGVVPGEYILSVVKSSWCWTDNSMSVTVTDTDVSNIEMRQKGYEAIVESSHAMGLRYVKKAYKNTKEPQKGVDGPQKGVDGPQKGVDGKFEVMKGVNELCFPTTGEFELTPLSCHVFDQASYTLDTDTGSNGVIRIRALKHKVTFRLMSEQAVTDVGVKLRLGNDEQELRMPPTKLKHSKHISELEKELDVSITEISATVSSSLVLFKQTTYTAEIRPDQCPAALVEIHAYRGTFVEGSVTPNIQGLNVELSDGQTVVATITTDSKGNYRFGPLPENIEYSVMAEKMGYVLAKEAKNPFLFKAFKLAEVTVNVKDGEGADLSGVILSLSGNAYKSNNRTDENGRFSFIGLSPGKYYLKAILKEYEFSPASVQVEVKEGVVENVRVLGKRIAYSCVGRVVDLKENPVFQPVTVRAEGIRGQDCVNTEESSQAEPNGQFRVRGLKPGCSYQIKPLVGTGVGNPEVVYRASPETVIIDMKAENVDIGRFTMIESLVSTDVAVFIEAAPEHLSSLKVGIMRDSSTAPVQSINVQNSKVVFFHSLPTDQLKYRVYMESSLSKSIYDYELDEDIIVADGPSKTLTLRFNPKVKTRLEYEVKESSVLALILVGLTTALVLNKDKVLSWVRSQR